MWWQNYFTEKSCQDYLLRIISSALDISFDEIKKDFELVDIRVNNKKEFKDSKVDVVAENNEYMFNLEINYNKSKNTDIKNTSYICQLLLKNLKPGRNYKYKDIKKVAQINLNNYDYYKKERFIYKTTLMEEELHIIRNDLITIIDIDVDYLSRISYNEIMNKASDSLEKLLYVFVCDDSEELDKVYLGDRLMEKVREKLDNYTSTLNEVLYYTKEDLIDKEVLDEKYNEGKKAGVKSGIEQNKIEIAKKMLEFNEEIEKISLYSGLSKEKIEEIRKSNKNC